MDRGWRIVLVGVVILLDTRGDTVGEHFQEFSAKLVAMDFLRSVTLPSSPDSA